MQWWYLLWWQSQNQQCRCLCRLSPRSINIFPIVPTPALSIESFQVAANAASEADCLANGGQWEWERIPKYAKKEAKNPGMYKWIYCHRWYTCIRQAQTDNAKNWIVSLQAWHFQTAGPSFKEFCNVLMLGVKSLASFHHTDDKKFTTWLDTINKKLPLSMDIIQCFHALCCWVCWFQWLNGCLPFMVKLDLNQDEIAWSCYSYKSNLGIHTLDSPDPPTKFKSFRLQAWRQFWESVMVCSIFLLTTWFALPLFTP